MVVGTFQRDNTSTNVAASCVMLDKLNQENE